MFTILSWLVYGAIVGGIARAIYKGETPPGWIPTIATGVAGSVFGGFIHSMLSGGRSDSAGIVFGVVGGVLACFLYTQWRNAEET
jgi:uncharacterized membrane protein YeaQ/YmgE (transglycosylase-associated protein family)